MGNPCLFVLIIAMKVLGIVLILATAVLGKHERYQGWKSYYVGPSTKEQFHDLYSVSEELELDFLGRPIMDREGIVLVKPKHQDGFTKAMDRFEISYRIHADDVKTSLDNDDKLIETRRTESILKNEEYQLPYDNYQEIEVIDKYLKNIASRYPDVVTLVTPANSFEGHTIQYLKISTTNFEDEKKPVIVIDGGIHAREWIAPPAVTWAIHKLVENVTEPHLLEKFDWVLLPVVNPDGYKYSFKNDRFWRKTRSTDTHFLSKLCPGVDGNRNYDFEWNTVGTSNSPCSDIYAGNRPFSEIETRVVRDIIDEHLPRIALYITVHSFGSYILYPWGHDGTLSNNGLALHLVGVDMAAAIFRQSLPNFPRYIVGNSALVLDYKTSGDSEDYAHSVGVPLSYTYELPGFGDGADGFVLDPKYIEHVVQETWEGIVVGAIRAGELFVGNK